MTSDPQKRLEFEGETIRARALIVSGVATGDVSSPLSRHHTFAVVGKGEVVKVTHETKGGVATRIEAGPLDQVVIVDGDLVEDILDEAGQAETGQLRLLSWEGETRRAARTAADERRRHVDELGWHAEFLDDLTASQIAGEVKSALSEVVRLEKKIDKFDTVEDYLDAVEEQMRLAAGYSLAGLEWARRRIFAHREIERLRVEEAAKVTVDETGTVLTAEEVAAARGDELVAP